MTKKKAMSMLLHDTPPYPDPWRKELAHMLHSRRKAEIEILMNALPDKSAYFEQPLFSYLVDKISIALKGCNA